MNNLKTNLKKALAAVIICILTVGLLPVQTPAEANENTKPLQSFTMKSKDNKVLTFQAGESKDWIFTVKNNTDEKIANVTITPQLGDDSANWPFETKEQDYSTNIGTLAAGETKNVTFTFTQRSDVPSARYTLQFVVSGDGVNSETNKFYVNTTAKTQEEQTNNKQSSSESSIANGEAYYSGSESYSSEAASASASTSGSVPRVIVTGFSTNPENVHAGQDFTLTISLKNTSSSSRVQNMLFEIEAPTEGSDQSTSSPAFLPTSGSNSIYLDGIAAGGTANISIKLNAKSDLVQKPYSINLSMKYEDANYTQIDSSSSLSIPVKQNARFELGEIQISPESTEVGGDINIMCSLYNLGKIKLYNVKAKFYGASIKETESFIGNVESGATASIDAMVTTQKVTDGPENITMALSYEDESGNVTETTQKLQLEVTEAADASTDISYEEESTSSGLPLIPIIVILVIAVVVAVILTKKHKKRKSANEEEALLNELDRSTEDELQ